MEEIATHHLRKSIILGKIVYHETIKKEIIEYVRSKIPKYKTFRRIETGGIDIEFIYFIYHLIEYQLKITKTTLQEMEWDLNRLDLILEIMTELFYPLEIDEQDIQARELATLREIAVFIDHHLGNHSKKWGCC